MLRLSGRQNSLSAQSLYCLITILSSPLRLIGDAPCYGIGVASAFKPVLLHDHCNLVKETTLLCPDREKHYCYCLEFISSTITQLYMLRFTLISDYQPLTTIFGEEKGIPQITPEVGSVIICIPYSRRVWQRECLANLLFSSV